jgi:RNA polymerase sigma-70 factor (ECF subfamily)
MVHEEQSTRLHQAILELPPRYRAVIELRHFQELSYEEMAEEMARPLSSVKSDLFRARKMLAEKMKEM